MLKFRSIGKEVPNTYWWVLTDLYLDVAFDVLCLLSLHFTPDLFVSPIAPRKKNALGWGKGTKWFSTVSIQQVKVVRVCLRLDHEEAAFSAEVSF